MQLDQVKKEINGKFANYSTTTEMNSAIKVKADSITQEVSKTYTKQTDFNSLYIGIILMQSGLHPTTTATFFDNISLSQNSSLVRPVDFMHGKT